MAGAVIAANQSLRVNSVVNASLSLATNNTQQVVYTAPANGYSSVNIFIECSIPQGGFLTLRVGQATIYQYSTGNNSGAQFQQTKPNGMQEGPYNSNVVGITFSDQQSPRGASFINVPIGPGQSITVQKGSNYAGGVCSVSGVEFINSP